MKNTRNLWMLFALFMVAVAVSCGTQPTDAPEPTATEHTAPPGPVVTDASKKLLFSWFEGDEAKTTDIIADIPEMVRQEVRVQDLSVPPDKRNPDWLYLADLTQKDTSGQYKVRAVERTKYERKRHPVQIPPEKSNDKNAATAHAGVIMYSTAHCPHCKTARRWLLEKKIPYKEIDLEKDEGAAMELAQKCQNQGVISGGVPMFEINGHIVPGFVPQAIESALKRPPYVAPSGNKMPPSQRKQPPVPSGTPPSPPSGTTPPSGITI